MEHNPVRLLRGIARYLLACIVVHSAYAYDVSVLVFDLQGKPVPSAAVWLTQDRVPVRLETDETGRCIFSGVGIGPVEIVAWKKGFAIGGRDARVVGSAGVAVALGEPGQLAVRLVSRGRNPQSGEELMPEPVEGARIETILVNDAFTIPVDDLVEQGFPSIRSDADGRLVLDYLPNGGHVAFRVSHRLYSDKYIHYPVGQREITVQMFEGVTLRGRVTNDAGEGIEHARVSIFRTQENDTTLREFEEVTTGPDGFYRAMLPPGDYHVTAKHPDYATAEPISGTLHPQDTEATCDLIVPTSFTVSGRVIGTDDAPVGGVRIQYVVNDVIYEQTLTSNEGRFTLKVASGEGRLHVETPDGYMTGHGTDIELKTGDADVVIDEPIQLQVLPEIAGMVLDENGEAVSSAFISTIGFRPPQFTRSDDAGRFAMQLPKVPDKAVALLRFEHPRRYSRADVVLSLADLRPLEVQLKPFEPNLAPCEPQYVQNKALDALRGKEAPPIACDLWYNVPFDTDGEAVEPTRESMLGKVVVLSFWGGFDRSDEGLAHVRGLRALYPILEQMEDVAVIGVHDSGTEEYELQQYIQELEIPYPVGRDKDAATFDLYDVVSVPQVVLIDKKGVLRYYDTDGRLLELIKSLRREAS
jgi:peroxiredoxin